MRVELKIEVFKKGLRLVAENFGFKAPEGMFTVWWNNLKDENLRDEDFEDGCIKAMLTLKRFPALAELLECCKKARAERFEAEYEKQRAQENRYRALDEKEILSSGLKHKNLLVRGMVENTMGLLRGERDYKTWANKQQEFLSEFKRQTGRTIAVFNHETMRFKICGESLKEKAGA